MQPSSYFVFFWKIIMLSHCASKFFPFSSRSSTRQILYMVSLHFMIIVQEKIFHALTSLSFLTTTKQQRLPLLRDFSTSTTSSYLCISTNNFMTALITLGFAAMSKANSVGKYLADDYYSPTKNLVFSPYHNKCQDFINNFEF